MTKINSAIAISTKDTIALTLATEKTLMTLDAIRVGAAALIPATEMTVATINAVALIADLSAAAVLPCSVAVSENGVNTQSLNSGCLTTAFFFTVIRNLRQDIFLILILSRVLLQAV